MYEGQLMSLNILEVGVLLLKLSCLVMLKLAVTLLISYNFGFCALQMAKAD